MVLVCDPIPCTHYTNMTSHLRIFSSTSRPRNMSLSSGTGFTLKTWRSFKCQGISSTNINPHHIMSCHITLHHITSCHVTSFYVHHNFCISKIIWIRCPEEFLKDSSGAVVKVKNCRANTHSYTHGTWLAHNWDK